MEGQRPVCLSINPYKDNKLTNFRFRVWVIFSSLPGAEQVNLSNWCVFQHLREDNGRRRVPGHFDSHAPAGPTVFFSKSGSEDTLTWYWHLSYAFRVRVPNTGFLANLGTVAESEVLVLTGLRDSLVYSDLSWWVKWWVREEISFRTGIFGGGPTTPGIALTVLRWFIRFRQWLKS